MSLNTNTSSRSHVAFYFFPHSRTINHGTFSYVTVCPQASTPLLLTITCCAKIPAFHLYSC